MRAAVTSSQNASRIKKLAFEQALMRLEFRVPPATDLALVKKLVKDIGKEIAADPELGLQFIEPLKSQDVRRVEDNAIIIGIKYIAKPDGVWLIRREVYQRLLQAFRAHGIELVGHGVVVMVEGAEAASPTTLGAATQVIQDRLAATAKAGRGQVTPPSCGWQGVGCHIQRMWPAGQRTRGLSYFDRPSAVAVTRQSGRDRHRRERLV